jgi:hypothetical protein
MTGIVDDLKTAGELLKNAAELVHEASKETSLRSEAARQSVREEVGRIRLKLFVLRRDLTILHSAAISSRRFPPWSPSPPGHIKKQ